MGRMTFAVLCALGAWGAPFARAEVSCLVRGAVRCPCPASLQVDCGPKGTGYAANVEKANSMVLSVFDEATGKKQDVALSNPPEGIRNYYAGLERDPWIAKQLAAKGITVNGNTRMNVTSAKFPDSMTVHRSPNLDTVTPGPAEGGGKPGGGGKNSLSCFYTTLPTMIKSPGCNEITCAGRAKCWKDGQLLGESGVACKAASGRCPTASTCAGDDSVESLNPGRIERDAFESDLRSQSSK